VFPPLTQETLVREQSDSSYRLILASFYNLPEAEKLLRDVRQKGYAAGIAPRRLARSLSVYRVEIEGLQDQAAVSRAQDLFNAP
jgi:cell division septation protein DedD